MVRRQEHFELRSKPLGLNLRDGRTLSVISDRMQWTDQGPWISLRYLVDQVTGVAALLLVRWIGGQVCLTGASRASVTAQEGCINIQSYSPPYIHIWVTHNCH